MTDVVIERCPKCDKRDSCESPGKVKIISIFEENLGEIHDFPVVVLQCTLCCGRTKNFYCTDGRL